MHISDSSNATLQPLGNNITASLRIPLLSPLTAVRPFILNSGANDPPEINYSAYTGANKTTLTTMGDFYEFDNNTSRSTSGLVRIVNGVNTCYAVISGFNATATFGTSQIGRFALSSVIQTFIEAGAVAGMGGYTLQDRIPQIPKIDVIKPDGSSSITVTNVEVDWNILWEDWNENAYPQNETTSLVYIPKYSNDGGASWFYCSDGTVAELGVRDSAYEITTKPYTWNISSSLDKGAYILRVECFRTNIEQHYSFDQVSLYYAK